MKKIINGKMYNTETARLIAEWDNGSHSHDRIEESLYVKKTGEYYLYYYGGALTKYAKSFDNHTSESSGILPLTVDDAKKWMEENVSADAYIKEFGEVEE